MENTSLTLTHHYDAPVKSIFDILFSETGLKKWFGPDPSMNVFITDIDFQVGGNYRIGIETSKGDEYIAVGQYQEIIENEKIVCTWRWESWRESHQDSLLTIMLAEKDGGTELTLTHSQLPDENAAREHTEGWSGALKRIPNAL